MKEKPIEILQEFKQLHYFKQDDKTKWKMLYELAKKLADYYRLRINSVEFIINDKNGHSGMSSWDNDMKKITLINRLSLITFFHEVGHAVLGNDENQAQSFAIDTFKYLYPRSYSKLISLNNGRMMIKRD